MHSAVNGLEQILRSVPFKWDFQPSQWKVPDGNTSTPPTMWRQISTFLPAPHPIQRTIVPKLMAVCLSVSVCLPAHLSVCIYLYSPPTEVDGVHSDGRGVLAVALLVQQHGGRRPGAGGRGVQRVQVAHVGAQLFDRARPERVARGDQHAEAVIQQPEADLSSRGRKGEKIA